MSRFARFFASLVFVLVGIAAVPSISAQTRADRPGELVDRVIRELRERFKPRWFEKDGVKEALAAAKVAGDRASTLAEAREITFRLLERFNVSHLGLLSRKGWQALEAELHAKKIFTVGFQLVHAEDGYFVEGVTFEGAGDRVAIKNGDRVVTIDGQPVRSSPRLDIRSDDAALPDSPRHLVLVSDATPVRMTIERSPGETIDVTIVPFEDSGYEADRRAVCMYDLGRARVGFIPLRFMYYRAVDLFRESIEERFENCSGLVIDLRGRGGSGDAARDVADLLVGKERIFKGPIVCLIDGYTRSAKEILAYDLARSPDVRLVGEKTSGAVRPCTFIDVGNSSILMAPLGSGIDPEYTREIELIGVSPDVSCRAAGRYAAGADPILEKGLAEIGAMIDARRRRGTLRD